MGAVSQDILLVEDNPGDARLIRELLADELGRDAFLLRVAESLADALELIVQRYPDVVVLDLSLPDSLGLSTLYRIEAAAVGVPVVVLTGNEDQDVALSAVKAGAQDFLVKHELSGRLLTKTIQYARERKHNEASLRTSEARFRSLAELSSDWYWEQDAQGRLTYLSEGLFERSGIDPARLLGRTWQDVLAADAADRMQLGELFASRRPFQDVVVRYASTASGTVHLSIGGVPIVEHGQFTGYRGLGKDVTARERAAAELRGSEERFRKIMDTGRDGIVMLDPQDTILFANRQAAALLGAEDALLQGRTMPELVAQDGDGAASGPVPEGRAVTILRTDGQAVFAMESRYPLAGPAGEHAGTLIVLTDLARHQEREARLGQLAALAAQKSEAERSSSAKSSFMAAVSHDLRQPMHAMGLFIDDLKNASLPEKTSVVIGYMEAALLSAQSLLDSILIFSRLESGQVVPNMLPVAIEPILDRVRSAFRAVARQKNLRFMVGSSDAVVHSDPALLERICFNLVSNALRYTERGGVIVACRNRGDALLLEVWDTGVGIPPEQQEAVFREFYRIDHGQESRGGAGLGLAIVRSCAMLMDCPVRLRSVPGKGSRFSLRIPRAKDAQRPAENVAPDELEAGDEAAFQDRYVVLVDDDALILEGTRSLLCRWGCEVLSAASWPELEVLLEGSSREPDLVISDLRLGEGDLGVDVVARMRRRYRPSLPALLISGDTSLQTAREVRSYGLTLLYKPVAPNRLRAAMASLLAR
jgi:PAS domain S-box-containing protein